MHGRALLLGLVISVALAAVVCVLCWSRIPRASRTPPAGVALPDARLQALEDEVRRSLAGLEQRWRRRFEVADPAGEPGEEDPLALEGRSALERIAALESRLEALEVRLVAQEEDPVLRGFTYLSSKNWRVRQEGIRMLQKLARYDPENLEAIRNMLDDPESEVREEALKALGEVGDREAIPRITALLGDAAPGVREEAVESLADLLKEKGSETDAAAAADTLMERLADADRDVREAAAEALGDLNLRKGVEALIKSLEDPEAQVRDQALSSLVKLKDESAIPALRALYAGGGGTSAMALAAALKELGDEQPFQQETERLARLARSGDNVRTRWEAVKALGEYAAGPCRRVLEEALQDGSPLVRKEAERALQKQN